MALHYLNIEEVITLHEYAIQRFGGLLGVRDRGRLEAAIAAPQQTMFGDELYPDIWSKAAIVILLLIKNHPFIDGNKRVGLYAMLRFLEINGYTFSEISNDELYEFTLKVATSSLDKDDIAAWLKTYVRKIDS